MGPNSVGTGVLSQVKAAGVTNEWSYTASGVLISP